MILESRNSITSLMVRPGTITAHSTSVKAMAMVGTANSRENRKVARHRRIILSWEEPEVGS